MSNFRVYSEDIILNNIVEILTNNLNKILKIQCITILIA